MVSTWTPSTQVQLKTQWGGEGYSVNHTDILEQSRKKSKVKMFMVLFSTWPCPVGCFNQGSPGYDSQASGGGTLQTFPEQKFPFTAFQNTALRSKPQQQTNHERKSQRPNSFRNKDTKILKKKNNLLIKSRKFTKKQLVLFPGVRPFIRIWFKGEK